MNEELPFDWDSWYEAIDRDTSHAFQLLLDLVLEEATNESAAASEQRA